jgi:hypothetical protein
MADTEEFSEKLLEEIPFHGYTVKVYNRAYPEFPGRKFLNYLLFEGKTQIGHLYGEQFPEHFEILHYYSEGNHSTSAKTKIIEALREVAEENLARRGVGKVLLHTNAQMEHHLERRGYTKDRSTFAMRKELPGAPVKSIFRRIRPGR